MRHDLKVPCKNCPFRKDETRIRFRGRERANEIEESAYRNGFPCHKSAVLVENEDGEGNVEEGYAAGEDTQHCVGYVIVMLNQGEYAWPGIDNDDEVALAYEARIPATARKLCFDGVEDFLAANSEPEARPAKPNRKGKR